LVSRVYDMSVKSASTNLPLTCVALFCNFALLALIFAAWNVDASTSIGLSGVYDFWCHHKDLELTVLCHI
jgi:hypothetical protein